MSRHKHLFSLGFVGSYLLLVVGCGLQTSLYVDYDSESAEADIGSGIGDGIGDETGGGVELSEECKLVLPLFEADILPALDGTCAACHNATVIAGKTLVPGDAAKNREILLAYDNSSDGKKLADKVSNKTVHGGGDMSSSLSLDSISKWKAAETACTTSSADSTTPPSTSDPVITTKTTN